MEKSRRKFTKNGLLIGLGLPMMGTKIISCSPGINEKNTRDEELGKPLSILILGGTSFLGPHQIAYALSKGHTITTFTRGKTKPTIYQDLFDRIEQLVGDRKDNLKALENRKWDVVIDNSGHDAAWTKRSAELLKNNVDMYVYTSSTGVYYPYLGENIDENTSLLMEEPSGIEDEDLKMEYWYGVMKTNSEQEARKVFGKERTLIVRPTYMIGPGDKSDRFIYWPVRLTRGGEIMVPGKDNDPVQYIDVRDVAEWMIRLIESKTYGTFNAVGPAVPQTMPQFVQKAVSAFDIEHDFVYINDYTFLKDNKVPYLIPWIMPVENNYGTARISNEKGIANGLYFRALKQSVQDIYDWWYSDALTDERRLQFEEKEGSVLLREKDIIKAWKAR